MPSAQQAEPAQKRIIIHHLSDLHFQQRAENNHTLGARQDPLVKYRGYLDGLPLERRPDLIVITGDLTATGNKNDLTTIATILRNDFPRWDTELAHHIFVVPGPRDVSWERKNALGLTAFYDAFHDFAFPSRARNVPEHGTAPTSELNCIVYSLDTCYTLDEFREDLKEEYHEHAKEYREYVKRFREAMRESKGWLGLGKRKKRTALDALRAQYLQLTEGNPLTLLDAGRIDEADLQTFIGWITASASAPTAADGVVEPLKILITHHPLAIQPDFDHGAGPPVQQRFSDLMDQARKAGFHLALHGHIHKPQVLSDLSILEGTDAQHPLRQIGAGSLGDDGMFNEITAVYSEEQDQRQWRLEIRTVNVLAEQPDNASSLVLLNPTEAAAEEKEHLKRVVRTHNDFDTRVRSVMRQFSELIFQTQAEDKSEKKGDPLPQLPMQAVESIIRDVVFKDFSVRVRLLLKDKETNLAIPRLKATYLAPPPSDGLGTLTYPASVAAWSLVLGRTLVFPSIKEEPLTLDDYDWLKRSAKVQDLLRALEALQDQAATRSYPALEDRGRYELLHHKLVALRDSGETDLHGSDLYQEPLSDGSPPNYPYFVCIPFPLRSRTGGFVPEVPEIAVLDVGVRIPERSSEQREPADESPAQIFNDERRGMLEFLVESVGMILMTSSALGKPKGKWDTRL